MSVETKRELILNALRWVSNILVEVLSNYGGINDHGRLHLKAAVSCIEAAQNEYRKAE